MSTARFQPARYSGPYPFNYGPFARTLALPALDDKYAVNWPVSTYSCVYQLVYFPGPWSFQEFQVRTDSIAATGTGELKFQMLYSTFSGTQIKPYVIVDGQIATLSVGATGANTSLGGAFALPVSGSRGFYYWAIASSNGFTAGNAAASDVLIERPNYTIADYSFTGTFGATEYATGPVVDPVVGQLSVAASTSLVKLYTIFHMLEV